MLYSLHIFSTPLPPPFGRWWCRQGAQTSKKATREKCQRGLTQHKSLRRTSFEGGGREDVSYLPELLKQGAAGEKGERE